MISKNEFLNKYNFEKSVLDELDIEWESLRAIYDDYLKSRIMLEEYANLIANILRKQNNVHTVRTRVKDPEHLIAKLIRKWSDRRKKYGEDFKFTIENYQNEITDLIGIRVIHIFKEEWLPIHKFILDNWTLLEAQANIRKGDEEKIYSDNNVDINSRNSGYRSVHYLVSLEPTKKKIIAEIQVRTIFEEGYGEIDHQLSYPNDNVPEVLKLNLLMLNRLAGSANEMASTVLAIKSEWCRLEGLIEEKDSEIEVLKRKINSLNIEQTQKDDLNKQIENFNRYDFKSILSQYNNLKVGVDNIELIASKINKLNV